MSDRSAFSRPAVATLLVCGLVMLIDGYETQAISYALPLIAAEWSLSKGALGPLLSSALVGSIIGFCCAPSVSRQIGHQRITLVSMIAFSVLILLTSLAPGLDALMVIRFFTGLSLGATIPSVIAIAYQSSPPARRATAIVLIYCCFSLGFALAGLAAGTLIGGFGWRSLFWLGAAAPALALFAVARWVKVTAQPDFDDATGRVRQARLDVRRLWLDLIDMFSSRPAAGTLLIWLSFALINSEFYFMQSWLPSMLTTLHYPITSLALVTSLSTIGGALSAVFIGPAMDRFERYRVVAWLFVAAALFVGAIGLSLNQPPWQLMLVTFCAGFCVSGVLKSLIALAALFYSSDLQPVGSGWSLGIGRVGGALGPLVVGAIYTSGVSPRWIFLLATIPLLLGAVIVLATRRYQVDASEDGIGDASVGAAA